ncbi:RNA 2',3'-cyclic phosphate--5'-hydroxyl ligase [bacterium 336/3]|nr:RNA 2',3'-cyclic phosphate--5'-hydroxyl ligase [bacterium 336/3]
MASKINNNELKIFFQDKELLEEAGKLAKFLLKKGKIEKKLLLETYEKLVNQPEKYTEDETFGEIAKLTQELQPKKTNENEGFKSFELRERPLTYQVFGKEHIEETALYQMDTAMKLPISVAGALMPDAHQGYGLPIGGVLATESDKIIPFAVGVDIACRMCLSVFELDAVLLEKRRSEFKKHLGDHTYFGIAGTNKNSLDDEVWEHPDWKATPFIRSLYPKALSQIGTSGTGNHFVEWGVIEIVEENSADLGNLPKGNYVALLSHSGSRGFGAGIANHYSKLAIEQTKLPREAQHLAWLDLNTEAGQEYWIAMNLAGEYAAANHHQIHRRMAKALGKKPLFMIENHHNFAWKEKLADGTEVMVHRKGATPAQKGVLGIIPSSMATQGFVVRGKGEISAVNSASHGSGRLMSRNKALNSFTMNEVKKNLQEKGVTLIGGDLDEAPMAYKDINDVMLAQRDLVEIIAKFSPKVVRMAESDENKKGRED